MSLSKFTDNVNNVQNLADRPTESAEELKRTFDTAGNEIKEYINQILTAEIDALIQNLQDGKIDTTKIVNDLTTGGANKVASAEMAKALKNQIDGKANTSHTHTKSQITDFTHTHKKADITDFTHTHKKADITDFTHTHKKADITDFSHTHDDRYYTESEMNTKLNGKANTSHTHTASQITDLKSGAKTKISSGTAAPSGGDNGDVYIQYFT